jgi:8-oxo-dGTP diphosphatase
MIFIAKRKVGGDLGGKWEFPGGKAEDGEHDEDALRREYLEELGIAVEVGPLLASAEFTHNESKYILNAYRIFFASSGFSAAEHSEWRWASMSEIAELDFASSDSRLIPALKVYLDAEAGINH